MIDLFFMLIFPPPPGSHVGIKTDYQLSQCIRVYSTWDIPRQSVCLPIRWGFYYCEKESITRLSTASTSQLTACISIPLFIYLLVSSITLFFVRPINMPDRSRFIGFKVSSLFNFQERQFIFVFCALNFNFQSRKLAPPLFLSSLCRYFMCVCVCV